MPYHCPAKTAKSSTANPLCSPLPETAFLAGWCRELLWKLFSKLYHNGISVTALHLLHTIYRHLSCLCLMIKCNGTAEVIQKWQQGIAQSRRVCGSWELDRTLSPSVLASPSKSHPSLHGLPEFHEPLGTVPALAPS